MNSVIEAQIEFFSSPTSPFIYKSIIGLPILNSLSVKGELASYVKANNWRINDQKAKIWDTKLINNV